MKCSCIMRNEEGIDERKVGTKFNFKSYEKAFTGSKLMQNKG